MSIFWTGNSRPRKPMARKVEDVPPLAIGAALGLAALVVVVGLVVLVGLLTSGCIPQNTHPPEVGDIVRGFYVRDAKTGHCLYVNAHGKYNRARRVAPQECQ